MFIIIAIVSKLCYYACGGVVMKAMQAFDLIKYLQSVFTKQIGNPKVNPYYEYSSRIEERLLNT